MNNSSNHNDRELNQDVKEAASKHPFIERNSCRPFDLANKEHKMVHEVFAECWKQAGQKGPTPELYVLRDVCPDLIRLGSGDGRNAFVLTNSMMQMIVGESPANNMTLGNRQVLAALEESCRHSVKEGEARALSGLTAY